MSSKAPDLSGYNLPLLAEAVGDSVGVAKLCLYGPRPNVEIASIDEIKSIEEAKAMLRRAKSDERRRLIVKKWIELCGCMAQLNGPFNDDGCPCFYFHDDLRGLRDAKANEFADTAIFSLTFRDVFQNWQCCPTHFVADRLAIALLRMCGNVSFGRMVLEHIEESGRLESKSTKWIYWAFMEKMSTFATPEQASVLISIIRKHKRFDHEIPACAALVRRVAESDEYKH